MRNRIRDDENKVLFAKMQLCGVIFLLHGAFWAAVNQFDSTLAIYNLDCATHSNRICYRAEKEVTIELVNAPVEGSAHAKEYVIDAKLQHE